LNQSVKTTRERAMKLTEDEKLYRDEFLHEMAEFVEDNLSDLEEISRQDYLKHKKIGMILGEHIFYINVGRYGRHEYEHYMKKGALEAFTLQKKLNEDLQKTTTKEKVKKI